MKQLKKMLFPGGITTVLLVLLSTALLIYVFISGNQENIIAYISYLFSAYALTVVVLKIPVFIKKIRQGLYANKYSKKYLTEAELRAKISLYAGFTFSAAYAVFKFMAGVYFRSLWIGAIAVYYVVLAAIRVGLVKREYYGIKCTDEAKQRKQDLQIYKRCGYLMFLLNVAVAGIVIQMIWQNKSFTYPGLLIYASAAYTFYCFTMAIVNLVKYRKLERPILSAAKMISFAGALTSMLSLQTALLAEFSEGQAVFIRLMNSLTGTAVCTAVFLLAIRMIQKTKIETKRMEIENENK